MLYTLSKSQYDHQDLQAFLSQIQANDCVLLWQDGVLQAVKNPQFFANLPRVVALENDVKARGLNLDIPTISLDELVALTEQFYPQVAL